MKKARKEPYCFCGFRGRSHAHKLHPNASPSPRLLLLALESVLKVAQDDLDDILYPDEELAISAAKEYIRKNK